ncbi:MAG: carboxypeptidase regulatory-like domain-containing protein [Acidobacteriota bacterium]|nr:carboxypeptidase regulatory-like domain-containing protein [Blastocatellia bacterium]MDW8240961.1 carboxypeptidase regulatory-like domain-containing protein [Acidobacteriota bacterium]
MRPMILLALAGALFSLVLVAPTFGQATTASLVGTVTDRAEAVVPGVAITVINVETNQTRQVVTNDAGEFVVTGLSVGRYSVKAERTGFKTKVIESITLRVDQRARVDITLEVGQIEEQVVVTDEAPLLQTESAAIGSVIDNRKILELPLNGRGFAQLATLTPGAIQTGTSGFFNSPLISVNGARATKTEFLLDGITNSELIFGGLSLSPSVDAIQEFKVQSSGFAAEFGRGAAEINTAIKSGTNEIHGAVFEFLRNDKLDARNFFTPTVPPLKRNQFGFALGGPLIRNDFFYFGNYEGTRERRGTVFNAVVPSAAFRQGDFSSLLPTRTLQDPRTGQPFANNRIPTTRFSPPAVFFLKFFPLPNTPAGTFVTAPSRALTVDQFNIRVDKRLSAKDHFYARYSFNDIRTFDPGPFPEVGGNSVFVRHQNAVLVWTRTFSPSILHEFRFGYSRLARDSSPQGLGTDFTSQSGIRGFEETAKESPGFPTLNIAGLTSLNGQAFSPLRNIPESFQWIDNVTIVRGKHTIKAGLDWRRFTDIGSNAAFARGVFTFSGVYTGNAFADYLLGLPSGASRSFPRNTFGMSFSNFHQYVQDDWRIRPNLTLNLGLRYEVNLPAVPLHLAGGHFDQSLGVVVVSSRDGSINLTSQQVAPAAFRQFGRWIIPSTQTSLPTRLRFTDWNDFAPRFGLAWQPLGRRTVIRLAGGIFYLERNGNTQVSQFIINPPFIVDESLANDVPTPTRDLVDFFRSPVGVAFTPPLIFSLNPRQRTAYLSQWNLVLQQEITRDLAVELGYVGNKGTRLEDDNVFNIPPPGPGPIQPRRPFPQFGLGVIREDGAASNYHALQAKVEKRFSQGLTFLLSYNWSKVIDNCSNDGNVACFDNPFNKAAGRAVADFDVPHRFVFSYLYELPFGRGRPFLNTLSGLANHLLGGWQIAGIVVVQSGLPFSPTVTVDTANIGVGTRRPNRIGSGRVSKPTLERWFNPADFTVPPFFSFGNSGRNILRGDRFSNVDFALHKNFAIRENSRIQFRAEFFNLFNHPNFGLPVTAINVPTAGRVLSATDPRIIQFGLRFEF